MKERWYNKPYEKPYMTGGTIGGGPDPMWGKTYTTTWIRQAGGVIIWTVLCVGVCIGILFLL